ncbi:hypothetical protein [Mycolicibacterium fortuitum]|uniref:hypothetical protein n=1 Tax=Mycolicibacterium fortuitum TaxID=1766 RepID=UPI001CE21151|nr:hypothetical protein [Mycolicibacterium fortuitum]MCA4726653.1 hypothetical protein [Mycolicibacterium fortuitum]
MTPTDLYLLLGLGIGMLGSVFWVVWSILMWPRVWRKALQGQPLWALVMLAQSVLVAYGINQTVPMPTEPGWQNVPIVCDAMCGWNYFYVVAVGVFAIMSVAATLSAAVAVCTVAMGVISWCARPAQDSGWDGITNGQWLDRQFGLLIGERSLARILAPQLGNRKPPHRVRDFGPEQVRSSFFVATICPCGDEIDLEAVRDLALSHDMVVDAQFELWDPDTDQFEVLGAAVDAVSGDRQALWIQVTWDPRSLERVWSRPLRIRRRRTQQELADAAATSI